MGDITVNLTEVQVSHKPSQIVERALGRLPSDGRPELDRGPHEQGRSLRSGAGAGRPGRDRPTSG